MKYSLLSKTIQTEKGTFMKAKKSSWDKNLLRWARDAVYMMSGERVLLYAQAKLKRKLTEVEADNLFGFIDFAFDDYAKDFLDKELDFMEKEYQEHKNQYGESTDATQ